MFKGKYIKMSGIEFKMVCATSPKSFNEAVAKCLSEGFLPMGQHTHTHSVTPDGVEYMQLCISLARDIEHPSPLVEKSQTKSAPADAEPRRASP